MYDRITVNTGSQRNHSIGKNRYYDNARLSMVTVIMNFCVKKGEKEKAQNLIDLMTNKYAMKPPQNMLNDDDDDE